MDIKIDIWRNSVQVSGIAGTSGEETFITGTNCESITVCGAVVCIDMGRETLVLPVTSGIGSVESKKKDANEGKNAQGHGAPQGSEVGEDKPKRSSAGRRGRKPASEVR